MRIIAMAEAMDGPEHPSEYGPPDSDPHELATMKFHITNDYTLNGQFAPISFYWNDCGDNAISSVDGETLYIDYAVYDSEENVIWNEEDDVQFPEDARIPNVGAPDSCVNSDPDKPQAIRFIEFINGGVDIVPSDSIDARGDINLNGAAYEIADAVVFTQYFIYGLSAFSINEAGQIAATDINADGIVLTVGDLIYLINVIVNGWPPLPKLQPVQVEASVDMAVNHSAATFSIDSPLDIGGGYFVIEHDDCVIGEPHLINGASHLTLEYSDHDGLLKILIYSMEKDNFIQSGNESIFSIPLGGKGTIRLAEVQLADTKGRNLTVRPGTGTRLPDDFMIHQNYPNPFNCETQIIYEIPNATYVSVEIINSAGQLVMTLVNKQETAGIHRTVWNGIDSNNKPVASGVYFYKLVTPEYSKTRKMMFLK